MRSYRLLSALLVILFLSAVLPAQPNTAPIPHDYPVLPVSFSEVQVTDQFWAPRIRLNHTKTIPYAFEQSEETGRIKNFEVAAGQVEGSFCSIYPFDDSDVYKIIEGASYSLQTVPDSELDAYLDRLIAKIAAAQEPDGYLYTNRTILGDNAHEWAGKQRWERVHELSHELYNLGHLFEAAAAHYQATGKRTLLNVATKSIDLLVRTFGWGKREDYPGHQEVEIGLAKLYRITGRQDYLDLAKFFLDVRGPGGDAYNQAHLKVLDQAEAVGHAVRANYMYSAMADVAALTGDHSYVEAIDRIWNDVVSGKIYLTGGVGSTSSGEAYGADYELPNLTAYCETCASIANVFWNQRMFLLHGDARYIDVLERTLYNGVLSGLGLSGDRFFYPNRLQSVGKDERSAWFGCACCPSNLTRFLPSIPGYIYAHKDERVYVNLFITSNTDFEVGGRELHLSQTSSYPWDGDITISVEPEQAQEFELAVRVPGWTGQEAIPSDLYRFEDGAPAAVDVKVNGTTSEYRRDKGYALLRRTWNPGDRVEVTLPMPVRRVLANTQVAADRNQAAIQRGPLVYCLEWPDNPGRKVLNLRLAEKPEFTSSYRTDLLSGVVEISGKGFQVEDAASKAVQITAIPYYAWANRGRGEMTVWIPETK
jgi:DUF1680 family protein